MLVYAFMVLAHTSLQAHCVAGDGTEVHLTFPISLILYFSTSCRQKVSFNFRLPDLFKRFERESSWKTPSPTDPGTRAGIAEL